MSDDAIFELLWNKEIVPLMPEGYGPAERIETIKVTSKACFSAGRRFERRRRSIWSRFVLLFSNSNP